MVDASMLPGESIPAWGDRIGAEHDLPAETVEAVTEFAEFLRYGHVHDLRPGEPVPPNVLRRFRRTFGMTHAEIDDYEGELWRQEVARIDPIREDGRT